MPIRFVQTPRWTLSAVKLALGSTEEKSAEHGNFIPSTGEGAIRSK